MRDPREDVLNKMDALLKKHHATEPDIPVLTDIVEHPRVDLESIPVLTEEVDLVAEAYQAPPVTPVETTSPQVASIEQAPMERVQQPIIELDLMHPSGVDMTTPVDANSVLQRLEAVEAEVQAEIEARISQTQSAPNRRPTIEVPQGAQFISLSTVVSVEPAPPVKPTESASLPEDLVKQVAAMIEADVGRIIKKQLHQSLDQELSGMLATALDKALSSMLEQFMVHMEEVVRNSIADELKKQLAPFKRPAPPPKS